MKLAEIRIQNIQAQLAHAKKTYNLAKKELYTLNTKVSNETILGILIVIILSLPMLLHRQPILIALSVHLPRCILWLSGARS